MISLVTTYKNRPHHIVKTLHTWVAAHPDEIIIVDYDSDDDIVPLIKENAQSKVPIVHVKCEELPVFNLSHARNIGAAHAMQPCLLFVDIDTYLKPQLIDLVREQHDESRYLAAVDAKTRKEIVNGGLLAVSKKHHDMIYGFNEDLCGWGFEDIDYKRRLERRGLIYAPIGEEVYECIDHPDEERVQCYDQEKEISWTQNRQIALKTWDSPEFGEWKNIFVRTY